MTKHVQAEERRIDSQVAVAIADVAAAHGDAIGLLNVLAFMGADDIPRRLLKARDPQLVSEVGAWAEGGRALMAALTTLLAQALVTYDGVGVFMHRNRQEAVLASLEPEVRSHYGRCAGQLVIDAMPDPRIVDEWTWAARTVRHAIVVSGHLEDMAIDPLLSTRLRCAVARFQMVQGQLEGARDNLRRAHRLAERFDPSGRLHGTVLIDLADAHRRLGEFSRALEFSERAFELHRGLAAATVGGSSGEASPAHGLSQGTDTVTQVARRAGDLPSDLPADRDVAEDLRIRGLIEQDRGRLDEAYRYLSSAYSMFEQTSGVEDLDFLACLENLFGVLLEAGDLDAASEALRHAMTIKTRMGVFAEDVEDSRLLLAVITGEMAPVEGSKQLSERFRTRYGAHHQETANGLHLLGAMLTASDRAEEARAALQAALDVDITNLGPNHYRVAQAHVSLMRLFLRIGDLESATAQASQALDVVLATQDSERAAVLRLTGMVDAVVESGDVASQRLFLESLLALANSGSLAGSDTAMSLDNAVSRALIRSGDRALRAADLDMAQAEYEKALELAQNTTDTPLDDLDAEVRLGYLAGLRSDEEQAYEHWSAALELVGDHSGSSRSMWFLVRIFGQLSRVMTPTEHSRRALERLMDEMEGAGKLTRFKASISSLVPDGWFVKESVTLLAPDGQANIIASTEPLDPSIDTETYAEKQGELLRAEFPGYEELWAETREVLGGREGILRAFTWTPEDGVPVTQIQLYFADPGRGYTATATTPASKYAEVDEVLLTALLSLRIGDTQVPSRGTPGRVS